MLIGKKFDRTGIKSTQIEYRINPRKASGSRTKIIYKVLSKSSIFIMKN